MVKSRLALRGAFKLDAWLGRHRNVGVEPELHLPAPRLVSKAATLRLFPGVRPNGLTGGAQWYDYQMVEGDRLTLAFATAADRAGADLANHVEAIETIRDGQRIAGMRVRDRLTGDIGVIRAAAVVNAAGSRAGHVMEMFGVKAPFPLLKAMNLVTSKPASDMAAAAPTAGGRMLTLVPWRGRAIVGTSQSTGFVQPGDSAVTPAEIDAFITEANEAFPALKLTRSDVTLVHRGIVPAVAGRGGVPELKLVPEIRDHASEGAPGAITVVGVKYTTARGVAEQVTRAVAKRLGKRVARSRTATTVLPGAGIADHEALVIETARDLGFELPLPTIRHLIALYAESAAEIVRLMHARPDLGEPVSDGSPTLRVEIVYVIRAEMAVRLTDIVVRRTGLGGSGHPGRAAIEACARVAASELGWDDARVADEIAAVEATYA
jgi:glycerol-3-phosphate dehydrogenase